MEKKDLSRFDARAGSEEGRWLTLKDPETGADLDARMLLKGTDSKAYKDELNRQRERRLDELAALRAAGKPERVSPDFLEQEEVALFVVMTMKWEGSEWHLPYSPAAAADFFVGFPAFRAQVADFVVRRANFYPRSAQAS